MADVSAENNIFEIEARERAWEVGNGWEDVLPLDWNDCGLGIMSLLLLEKFNKCLTAARKSFEEETTTTGEWKENVATVMQRAIIDQVRGSKKVTTSGRIFKTIHQF